MKSFAYAAPTNIVFGRDTEMEAGRLVCEYGGSKVLVHYGGKSAKETGLLDKVCASLQDAGLQYVLLGGVVPNPRLEKVYEGVALCRREEVDFILAVGGGSVIDSAKAIAYGLANECDVWDIFSGKLTPKAFFPLGSVLTIAAAGSETSNSAVITKEEGLIKLGYNNEISRPLFAIMNPELTYSLPPYQTMSGIVDIMMHTLERYCTAEERTMHLTDRLAEGLLLTVMEQAKVLMRDPRDFHARAEIMWAGSLSHVGLMACGATRGDWASHQLEHELGGMFDVAHGAGLSAVWGSWARYVIDANPKRFALLAQRLFGVPDGDPMEMGLRGIAEMEAFFTSIDMPITLHELLGAMPEDAALDEMAEKCLRNRATIGEVKALGLEDIKAIFRLAK